MNPQPNQDKFYKQLQDLLDGQLSPEECVDFNRLIQIDPACARTYVESMCISASLYKYGQTRRLGSEDHADNACSDLLWQLLVDQERTADAISKLDEVKEEDSRPIRINRENIQPIQHKVSRVAIAVAAVSLAALLMMIFYVRLMPAGYGQPVATVTSILPFDGNADGFEPVGTRLKAGQILHIPKGAMHLYFDYGASVVLEGPAEIELYSPEQMSLIEGKLFAEIPAPAVGFIVKTPSCRVVDLGTRFGLVVEQSGSTQLHMVEGSASLLAGHRSHTVNSAVITAGQARYVNAESMEVETIPLQPQQFVQRFRADKELVWNGQPLSLASIVGKGNGFQRGSSEITLNPLTGQYRSRTETTREEQQVLSASCKVPENPFIDRVFIANAAQGPVQIAEGLRFDGFGVLPHGHWAGFSTDFYYVDDQFDGFHRVKLGKTAKPAIFIHSNMGITFDLEKIRQTLPGLEIGGFRALRGFRTTLEGASNKADFRVLVDGECVWQDLGVRYSSRLKPVWIPLAPDSRYLTLATTESDDGNGYDWTLFVDPVLELSCSQQDPAF